MEYNPIPSQSLSDSLEQSDQQPTQRLDVIPKNTDGVFANVKSKGEFQGLPSYDESLLIVDQAPPYLESTSSPLQDGDVLIDGLFVGSWSDFLMTFIMSFMFDFLGFFITSLLSSTHAGRTGSKFGFGFTLIRLGVLLQDELDRNGKKNSENIVSVLFILLGGFFTSKALSDYLLARKARLILENLTDF